MKALSLFGLIVITTFSLRAQDIERMLRRPFFSHSGGVSLQSTLGVGYSENDPSSFLMQLQYQPEFFGISLPFSMTLFRGKLGASHPFGHWRFEPKYKAVKASFGQSQMHFSPYTLGGHLFSGIGVEVKPRSAWSFAAMGGRLIDANPLVQTASKRMGYGGKVDYKGEHWEIGGHLFHAHDPLLSTESPKENWALGLRSRWTLNKNLSLEGEYANSAVTEDRHSESIRPSFGLRGLAGLLLDFKQSTASFSAYKVSATTPWAQISFERVDPNYHSLGAYYFTNDFSHLSIQAGHSFKKLHLNGSFGLQKDNLNGEKESQSKHFTYSFDGGYLVSKNLSLQASYSNLRTYLRMNPNLLMKDPSLPDNLLDSVHFVQINQNAQLSLQYQIPSKGSRKRHLGAFFIFQNLQGESRYLQGQLRYSEQSARVQLGATLSYQHLQGESQQSSVSASAFVGGKLWKEQISWQVALSDMQYLTPLSARSNLLVVHSQMSYSFRQKHQFQLQLSQHIKASYSALLQLSYQWNF